MHSEKLFFALGSIYATPGALAALESADVSSVILLARHVTGDWGELDKADQEANEQAVEEGGRVFSSYRLPTGVKVWVITEADRSATTLLLPTEY